MIAAHAARQDTPPTREIVVTATRVPTPVLDIPAGVSVIDRQTIEERGYTTLTDALSAVPGVRVSQSGGPGGNASVFVRGTNSNAVLVLRDGMPLNDASDASGAFNFGVDTLADVERIEIIRGPMAALYGSGAIGGVINLISRRGHEPGFHVTGELAGGYPKQMEGNVNASGIEGPFDYSATLQGQAQRGYDATPQRMSIYTGVPDPFSELTGTLNLGYTPIDGTRLSLFLRARRAVFGFDALGNPTFDNSNSTGQDNSLLGRIGVTSKLFNGTYETSAFLGRLQNDRYYTEALESARSQPAEQQLALPQLSHRRAVEQHGAPVRSDRRADAVGDRSHLRLRAHRRQHQREGEPVLLRLPLRAVGEGVHDRRRDLCRAADHAAAAPDADRADPPGLGRRQCAVHLAARRGARRAGGRDPLQGRLWHRVPRALAVRPLRRRFVRLRRQSQPAAGNRAGLGGRLHHHGRTP